MGARATQSADGEPLTAERLAVHIQELLGGDRGRRVEFRITAPRLHFARAEQVAQSLAALIRNSLDASPPTAAVVVTMAHELREVAITIEDHGAGIPEHVLARIGEPFFTTKQPGHGMGLGVFLARTFVESRGGALVIESNPGRGTRAIVRLPAEPTA